MLARRALSGCALLLLTAGTLAAHDLFLKLGDFFVSPGRTVRITAYNGTFTTSENSIARARVADLSLVGPGGRQRLDTTALTTSGPRTVITAPVGAAGTWIAGLSTRANSITLKGKEFNAYLTEEGLGAVLDLRRQAGELDRTATERYAKHVKTMFQAGDPRTDGWNTPLGYAAELVPLANPYRLHTGDTLRVRLLVNGAAAPAGQEAIAGGRTPLGKPMAEQHTTADASGTVAVVLSGAGTWYVKFISMVRGSEPGVDYVSNWATLTFALGPAARGRTP